MSPRAAWRLESLGFGEVYDYVAGKADWLANGLPTEGTAAGTPRIGTRAHRDTPTCGLGDRVAAAAQRAVDNGYDFCVVVNAETIVLGILEARVLHEQPDSLVEAAMRAGPSTFRPSTPVGELRDFLTTRRLHRALVTTSAGRLIGTLFLHEL
jgi:CBS domain-containing protein